MLALRVWAILLLVVVICGLIGYAIAPKSNEGFANEASILAFAALVAIGIERVLELLWSVLGQTRLGNWWPLKQLSEAIKKVEDETNLLIGPAFKQTTEALQQFRDGLDEGDARLTEIDQQLADLTAARSAFNERVTNARQLAKGSERMTLLAGLATEFSETLKGASSVAEGTSAAVHVTVDKTKQGVDLAMTIADSFTDNPARRIASILLGVGLGMIAAGFLGLNIFVAVLGNPGDEPTGAPAGDAGILAAGLGVVLTGIVLGLGSSPTHEVVKALQSYKASRTGTVDTVRIVVGARSEDSERMRRWIDSDASVMHVTEDQGRALRLVDARREPELYAVRTYRLRRTQ